MRAKKKKFSYKIIDPPYSRSIEVDTSKTKTFSDLKAKIAVDLRISESNFKIENPPSEKKLKNIFLSHEFKLSFPSRCTDIDFIFPDNTNVTIRNGYKMTFDQIIDSFKNKRMYYSNECKSYIHFKISHKDAPNILYPFIAVPYSNKVNVEISRDFVVLKYGSNRFIFIEDEPVSNAFAYIKSVYRGCFSVSIQKSISRSKLNFNDRLKKYIDYIVKVDFKLTFKCIDHLLSYTVYLDFLSTIFDAKRELVRLITFNNQIDTENISIYNESKQKIFDNRAYLCRVQKMQNIFYYQIDKSVKSSFSYKELFETNSDFNYNSYDLRQTIDLANVKSSSQFFENYQKPLYTTKTPNANRNSNQFYDIDEKPLFDSKSSTSYANSKSSTQFATNYQKPINDSKSSNAYQNYQKPSFDSKSSSYRNTNSISQIYDFDQKPLFDSKSATSEFKQTSFPSSPITEQTSSIYPKNSKFVSAPANASLNDKRNEQMFFSLKKETPNYKQEQTVKPINNYASKFIGNFKMPDPIRAVRLDILSENDDDDDESSDLSSENANYGYRYGYGNTARNNIEFASENDLDGQFNHNNNQLDKEDMNYGFNQANNNNNNDYLDDNINICNHDEADDFPHKNDNINKDVIRSNDVEFDQHIDSTQKVNQPKDITQKADLQNDIRDYNDVKNHKLSQSNETINKGSLQNDPIIQKVNNANDSIQKVNNTNDSIQKVNNTNDSIPEENDLLNNSQKMNNSNQKVNQRNVIQKTNQQNETKYRKSKVKLQNNQQNETNNQKSNQKNEIRNVKNIPKNETKQNLNQPNNNTEKVIKRNEIRARKATPQKRANQKLIQQNDTYQKANKSDDNYQKVNKTSDINQKVNKPSNNNQKVNKPNDTTQKVNKPNNTNQKVSKLSDTNQNINKQQNETNQKIKQLNDTNQKVNQTNDTNQTSKKQNDAKSRKIIQQNDKSNPRTKKQNAVKNRKINQHPSETKSNCKSKQQAETSNQDFIQPSGKETKVNQATRRKQSPRRRRIKRRNKNDDDIQNLDKEPEIVEEIVSFRYRGKAASSDDNFEVNKETMKYNEDFYKYDDDYNDNEISEDFGFNNKPNESDNFIYNFDDEFASSSLKMTSVSNCLQDF